MLYIVENPSNSLDTPNLALILSQIGKDMTVTSLLLLVSCLFYVHLGSAQYVDCSREEKVYVQGNNDTCLDIILGKK